MIRAYHLRSARLGFSTWTPDDAPLALALWGDPAVTRLIGGPFTEAQVRARLDAEMGTQRSLGIQYWPIFLLEGGAHVGCCGIKPHKDPAVPELGFHLRPAFWGRGLAPEAARAVIDHAFGALGYAALFAGHHPEHRVTGPLLEALGFVRTGSDLYPPTGLMHASYRLERG